MYAVPSAALKTRNRQAVTAFLYRNDQATKRVLETELGLSLPTITQNLRALEHDGLARRGTPQDSTGGRKAQTYAFQPRHRAAIGVAIRPAELTICAVDLYGAVIANIRRSLPYTNVNAYYQRLGGIVNGFAADVEKAGSAILGVAFSMQGILSADGSTVSSGTVMDNTGLTLGTVSQSVRYPCIMIHDSDASAMAELWFDPTISDALCLYLERRPGGAVIVNGRLYPGPNQHNGAIEHMTLVPGGRLCYCGQHGCMDAYCSIETLPEEHESILGFFSVLEQGEQQHRRRMEAWMDYVAQVIVNARSVLAVDVIIGGEAAQYLDDDDIAQLRRRVMERSAFGADAFELRKSRCTDNQDIVGAALRFIADYVNAICGTTSPLSAAEPA
ncbi:ROK family protein [Bifidobacterium sp.]|uniref:ROK family protein n=1 Tax=Bifidobacterium sp. TaxID=41200 RepID=UPI0025B83B12|nr:ROK family protein [Bifidobacterium sp.]MCH4209018.1 ROK family protein [Bifidobacterium sp.]MCI1225051.1 ROK family protein [Bifidobacterium sp.]